jgi:hypothetical protein
MQEPLFTEAYDDLSLSGRLKNILSAPSATYAAVRREAAWPDWLIPTLLVCLSGVLYHYMTGHIIFNPETPAIQEQLQALDEERRQKALVGMETWRTQGWLLVLSGAITSLALISGVLLLIARLIFRRDVTFGQMLAIKSYASLTAGIEWLVRIPLVLMAQSPLVHLGPGVLVAKDAATTFTGQLLISFNLFDCWQSLLLAIGLSVVAQVPRAKAVFVVFALWLSWLTAGAAMTILGASVPA